MKTPEQIMRENMLFDAKRKTWFRKKRKRPQYRHALVVLCLGLGVALGLIWD